MASEDFNTGAAHCGRTWGIYCLRNTFFLPRFVAHLFARLGLFGGGVRLSLTQQILTEWLTCEVLGLPGTTGLIACVIRGPVRETVHRKTSRTLTDCHQLRRGTVLGLGGCWRTPVRGSAPRREAVARQSEPEACGGRAGLAVRGGARGDQSPGPQVRACRLHFR